MDRYEEEIRRVAARSVRDLNLVGDLSSSGSPSPVNGLVYSQNRGQSSRTLVTRRLSSGSSSDGSASGSGGIGSAGVNVALAKQEYLRKVNLLNGGTIGDFNGDRTVCKSHNLVQTRRASASPPTGSFDRRNVIAASKYATAKLVHLENAYQSVRNGNVILRASPVNGHTQQQLTATNECSTSQVNSGSNEVTANSPKEFQPGVYPQFKRSSINNIPIYENLDGYPEVPQKGVQKAPPPPPPPYSGRHHIVSRTLPSSSSSTSSLSNIVTSNGKLNNLSSLLKNHSLLPHKTQPPYVAPPVYENVEDVPINSDFLNGSGITTAFTNGNSSNATVTTTTPSLGHEFLDEAALTAVYRDYVNLRPSKPPPPYPGQRQQSQQIADVNLLLRQQQNHQHLNGGNGSRNLAQSTIPRLNRSESQESNRSNQNGTLNDTLKQQILDLTRLQLSDTQNPPNNGHVTTHLSSTISRSNNMGSSSTLPHASSISQNHKVFSSNADSICATTASSNKVPIQKPGLLVNVTPPKPSGPTEAEKKVEALTRQIEEQMEKEEELEYFGECAACGGRVTGSGQACQAMSNLYHTKCFVCCSCGRTLKGKAFYNVNGKIYCEEDYMYSGFQQTSEKCGICGHLIMEMILRAMGKSYHPGCFRCCVCNDCLDGVPFTVDFDNKIYCINDFQKIFAPKCAACGHAIVPIEPMEETVRVVAMEKDFHVDCYVCEGCDMQLTDEPEQRCYPMGDHLFCKSCHIKQLGGLTPQNFEGVQAEYNVFS